MHVFNRIDTWEQMVSLKLREAFFTVKFAAGPSGNPNFALTCECLIVARSFPC